MDALQKTIVYGLAASVTIVLGSHVLDAALQVRDKIDHRQQMTCRQINEVMPGGCHMPK